MDFIRGDPPLVRVALSICLRLFAEKRQTGEWAASNFTSLGNSFLFNEVIVIHKQTKNRGVRPLYVCVTVFTICDTKYNFALVFLSSHI